LLPAPLSLLSEVAAVATTEPANTPAAIPALLIKPLLILTHQPY